MAALSGRVDAIAHSQAALGFRLKRRIAAELARPENMLAVSFLAGIVAATRRLRSETNGWAVLSGVIDDGLRLLELMAGSLYADIQARQRAHDVLNRYRLG